MSAVPTPPQDLQFLLEPIRQKYDLPALAGAILASRGLLAVGVAGVRKYGTETPAALNDQFHLGSNTKAMTATLLAMLVEEGKLAWSSTLEQVFPDANSDMDPAYRRVTLEQLLAHRAGLSTRTWPKGKTFFGMHRLPGTPREQRRAYLRMILAEIPAYAPGERFLYSSRSYVVAGAMAEQAADDSWENLMRQRLFAPLGMDTASFGAMGTAGRIDQPRQHRLFWKWHKAIDPGRRADNPPVIGPAGTVHCSIVDWARFIQAHLRGERGQSGILQPETFKRLHTPPCGGDYAFGWMAVTRPWAGGIALTHGGSNTMNFAVPWLAPAKDFAVLAMTNQGGRDAERACDQTAIAFIELILGRNRPGSDLTFHSR